MWRKALVIGLVLMAIGIVIDGATGVKVSNLTLWASSAGFAFADSPAGFAYTSGMLLLTFAGLAFISTPAGAAFWL